MRITDLNTLVTASLNDILYIVDVSDTGDFISGSSKQITVGNFFSSSNVGGGGGGGGGGGSGYLILTSSVVSSSVNIDSTVFTSNGVQTAYNVSGSVTEVADDIIVFINGVSQIPNVNYTLSSSILTFSGTPSSGSKIDVRRASSVLSVTFITSSMGVEYFAGNNSSSQFTLTNGQTVLHNYDVLVSLDGLIQKPTTDYSITGSTLNFTVPPPNNTDVEIRYLNPQTFTLISGSGGSGGGSGAGFPFSGSAVITGSLNVSQTITLNNTVISASGNTLYINGSPISILQFAYFSASISSSTETGILNVRNTLLQGKSLLNGNIYVNNLSSGSNMILNIYNSNTNALFQTETLSPLQNTIYELTDFLPLTISGSGYFTLQITASVT